MENETVQPNAETQPAETNQDRTAGTGIDAPVNLTQGALNSLIANEVRAEQHKLKAKYGDLDELAKAKKALDARQEADMSELERLQKQLADKDAELLTANAQADTERLNTLRLRVGQEVGLPTVLAARLQGADETELKADAEAVKAVMGNTSTARIPNIDAAAGGGGQTGGRTSVNLTPAQQKIATEHKISFEKYAESLAQFEE